MQFTLASPLVQISSFSVIVFEAGSYYQVLVGISTASGYATFFTGAELSDTDAIH